MGQILVVGASGVVGSEVARILKAEGHKVRTTTSKKGSLKEGEVHVNLHTGEGLKEAFEGVDRAFFMSPGGYMNQFEVLTSLINEGKKQKLKKVVMMTAIGVEAAPESGMRRAEVALENSGLNYNIIRPNWFMQNFNSFWIHGIKTQGKILLPVGQAKTSFIDARDIASVAAKLVNTDQYNNQALVLTGPEALDHDQVASVISEVTNKKVVYQEIEPQELKKGLLAAGLNNDYADFLLVILGALKAGYCAPVTDSVEKVIGRKPHDILKYARDYKQLF